MFIRMVIKTLLRQKKKMIMIALTIMLGISLSTAMMNVMLGIGDKVNRELKVYGANITVMPKDASLLGDLYGLDVADKYLKEDEIFKIKEIFWGYNIVDFAPFLESSATVEQLDEQVRIIGTWVQIKKKLPTGEPVDSGMQRLRNWWQYDLRGEWLEQNDDDAVMVGALLAGKNGLEVGDQLTLVGSEQSKQVTIKGIYTDGGRDDDAIVTTLQTAQLLNGLAGKITRLEVSALTTPDNELAKKAARNPNSLTPTEYETWYCTAYVSAICHQIQEVITDSVVKPVRQVAESEGTILNKVSLLMTLITILSSVGSALAISNLVTASVMERSQEIGLLKAIGALDLPIILVVLTEVLITGLIGGVMGYFVGLGFAQVIARSVFGSTIEIAQMVIPIVAVIVVVMTVIGSIPAIRYLLQLKPTEVLHGK